MCCALLCAGQPVHAARQASPHRECRSLDSSRELALQIIPPADGLLRIEIEERGISTVSSLSDRRATESASPIDRLGTITLAADARKGAATEVRVHAEDSPDVRGDVCISADVIERSDSPARQAVLALAAAGQATRATDWTKAFTKYLSAARYFDSAGAHRRAAMARHAMAELAYLRFDHKRDAYALASQALNDYGNAANPALVGELTVLNAKALLDMPGEDTASVGPPVRRLLAAGRLLESQVPYGARELPRVDIMMGFLEYLLDAPDLSQRDFSQAAARCRQLRDWDCYAVASQNLAQLAEGGKNYSAAVGTYLETLRRLPPELDPKLSADIWNNLGRVQGILGLFSASERSHDTAMQVYSRLGDCQGVRRSLTRVGTLLVHIGNLADAESDLVRAASWNCSSLLSAAAQTTEPTQPSIDPAGQAGRGFGDGLPEHACSHPLDPAALTSENKAIVFNSVLSLGIAAMMTGDGATQWRCLDAARSYIADSRSQIRLENARGAAFLERNDSGEARSAFTRALRLADAAGLPPRHALRTAAQLGMVKAMQLAGKAADSLPNALAALDTSAARGDIESIITSLQLIAAGYRGSGQTEAAIHVLQVAADLIEQVPIDELNGEQRAEFLASQHTVFAELTELLAGVDGSDETHAWLAFEASERGRARSLRYALNQEAHDASAATDRAAATDEPAPNAGRYRELLSELVNIKTGGTPLAAVDAIEHLAMRSDSRQPFERIALTDTLRQLDATLIEYASGPKEMLAFVVTQAHARVIHLGDTGAIERATAQLRDRLRDSETAGSDLEAAEQALARLVLWPITAELAGGRVIVVPEDGLHTVPLSVLPWAQGASQQPLVQHAESAVVPSALFLMLHGHRAAATHPTAPRMALLGDPVYRIADWRRQCTQLDTVGTASAAAGVDRAMTDWTESLPRLPGTRAEILGIARIAHDSRPGSRIETLVGCEAVPAALRKAAAGDVDLLHIATHARIDSQRPRLSALALTPSGSGASAASTFGLLDILGLKLNARLVVLSACDTSRGRLLPGEGVLGPAQAFLQAGAAAVLASYWRVDDRTTAAFMQRFYRYLLVDRLSAAAALRRAQLDASRTSPTHDWAAFSLYGWPDSTI